MQISFKVGLAMFLICFTIMINTRETNSIQIIQQQKNVNELKDKLAHTPDNRQLRNILAVKYANLNNIEAAEKHLQILLAGDTTDVVVLNNLGNLFFMKGDLDSAETFYLKAIGYTESKKDSDGIYLNRGLVYAAADLDSEAVDMFAWVMQDSNDYQRIGNLLGIDFEQDDLVKAAKLVPKKKIDKVTVTKLVDKARKKKKTSKGKKRKSKKTIGDKGTIPAEEIENILYWAYYSI